LSLKLKRFYNCPTLDRHQLTKSQPLNFLDLPVVAGDSARPAVAACGANSLLRVKSAPAAAPATYVHDLVALAH